MIGLLHHLPTLYMIRMGFQKQGVYVGFQWFWCSLVGSLGWHGYWTGGWIGELLYLFCDTCPFSVFFWTAKRACVFHWGFGIASGLSFCLSGVRRVHTKLFVLGRLRMAIVIYSCYTTSAEK